MLPSLLSLALTFNFLLPAYAKTENKKLEPAASPPKQDAKQLWSAWYTVIIGGHAHGYYKEEAEERSAEHQIAINQHWWETNHPLGISETMIGAVAKNSKSYPPVAFYVEKKTELSSSSFEGRMKDGKLKITVNPDGEKSSKKLPKNAIFSSQISLLIAEHYRKKNFKPVDFSAVIEDPKDKDFSAKKGRFQITKGFANIRGNDCFLANTIFENMDGKWWVTSTGKVCKVLLAAAGAKIELADEAEAKGFLKP